MPAYSVKTTGQPIQVIAGDDIAVILLTLVRRNIRMANIEAVILLEDRSLPLSLFSASLR